MCLVDRDRVERVQFPQERDLPDQDEPFDSSSGNNEQFEIWDGYLFDLHGEAITLSGRFIPTTAKEFDLALLLFRNLSKALSREAIMQAVWGYGADEPTRTLDAHISQIRKRLRLNPENGLLLTSVFRFGYRLEQLSAWEGTPPRGVPSEPPR